MRKEWKQPTVRDLAVENTMEGFTCSYYSSVMPLSKPNPEDVYVPRPGVCCACNGNPQGNTTSQLCVYTGQGKGCSA